MKYSTLIKDMIDEGATPEMILVAVRAVERQEEDALERRRASDRARQERHRNVMSRDTTLGNVSHGPSRSHAGVEDKTSSSEIEPPRQKAAAPAAPSPRQELEAVLDVERAEAVIEHRKRIKSPLTAHAAKLLAKDFAKCADPNGAADLMIKSGWRGFDPKWMDKPQQRAGPVRGPSLADVAGNLARELSQADEIRSPDSRSRLPALVPHLSAVSGGRG